MRPEPTQWSVVVVTQGDRPAALARAIASVQAQQGVSPEVIVVGNGWAPVGLPDGVVAVELAANLGAPQGRNRGLQAATGELLFFLDDDAALAEPDILERLGQLFTSDPRLGVVQTRIASAEGVTARRWVPRLWDKNPLRSSRVFTVVEGSVAVRATVLEAANGWAGRFRYAHEGIELAWRSWDAGFTVEYRADLLAIHPLVPRSRHRDYMRHDGRNRVWLAKRNLPWLIGAVYVMDWALVTLVRSPRSYGSWLAGCRDGIRSNGGTHRPLGWRTLWTMTRYGRPPLL
jgi:GT2 family glycosyltransferase